MMLSSAHKKRVIINADDFGLAESVNNGIVRAWRDGLVTSVSIMPCGRAFEHAVELIKENKMTNVGIHFALDEEVPISPPCDIPSLVDESKRFHSRATLLRKLLFTKEIELDEVERELRAQLERCGTSGLEPSALTHLNSHGHIHIWPYISGIVIGLAKQFGIKKVRIPAEPLLYFGKDFRVKHYVRKFLVSCLSRRSVTRYRSNGFVFADHFFGASYSGRVTINEYLNDMLCRAEEGKVTEIMVHPGCYNEEEMSQYKRWPYHWEDELKVLTAYKKSQLEKSANISFISYREL